MKRAVSGYAAVALLLCQGASAQEVPGDTAHAWVRLEVGALVLVKGGQEAGYARLAPALVLDGGVDWGLHVGASVLPRLLYSAEVRWRFARPLYALAQAGHRLSPGEAGTLRPASFVSLGLGVDHAR